MSDSLKHKRNLSENYVRNAGWPSSYRLGVEFDTFRLLQHADHVRTKPKMVATNATGGFGITKKGTH